MTQVTAHLKDADKAFYAKHYGIHPNLMEYAEVDEFLSWTNVGIDPRDPSTPHEWSGDGIVFVALAIYFTDNRPMSDAIDYLSDNIR